MNEIINNNNPFYIKLKEWYGNSLITKKVEVLHVYTEDDEEIYTVVFLMKEKENVEIARIFPLGNKMEISIDCQADTNTIQGIRKLIQYGGNFKRFEIED
jgi:hypothetical protein